METFDLEQALAEYPLPEGVSNEVVNRTQLARALNTSENTLSKWLSRGMPCLEEGGNGKDYEFQLSHCYAWRMARDAAERETRDRADEAAAQLAMHFGNDELQGDASEARLTPREIREQSEAHIVRMKAAQMRGDLIVASKVRAGVEEMLERVRRNIITLPDFAEREFGLNPDQVQALETRGFQVLLNMRRDIEELLGVGEVVDLAGQKTIDRNAQ